MTKEERAKKWFSNIPNAKFISIEQKINICNKVAKNMIIIFFGLLVIECILLFALSSGQIINLAADFLNSILEGHSTKNHYRGVAILGSFICLPIIVIPLVVAFLYKKKALKIEANKLNN